MLGGSCSPSTFIFPPLSPGALLHGEKRDSKPCQQGCAAPNCTPKWRGDPHPPPGWPCRRDVCAGIHGLDLQTTSGAFFGGNAAGAAG